LIVGVGYCLDGQTRPRSAYGALRTRDLTPSNDRRWLDLTAAARRESAPPLDIGPPGGAEAFLEFLIEELRPFIAEHYTTDPDDQTLVGSSLGGLFSLYALVQKPSAFANYVANSPALWWNEREIMAYPSPTTLGHGKARSVFLSVGGDEVNDAPWEMLENCRAFADRLGRLDGLRLISHVFEGETHTSVIPAAMSRGLRCVLSQS